jgi:glycosyltransferase involved in cell wall biosynthesis
MKILFLSDSSPNLENWIAGLKNIEPELKIETWSLTYPKGWKKKLFRNVEWFLWIFTINKRVERANFDIVIGYRIPSYGFLTSFIKCTPIVIAAQGASDIWPPNGLSSRIKIILLKRAVKKADLVQVWGNEMKKNINNLMPCLNKMLVLPRGIDLDIYNANTREKYVNIDQSYTYTFITTRSLSPDYNYDKLLNAFHEFKKFKVPFVYYIAGTGVLEDYLKKLTIELELENEVKFLGRLNLNQLSEYYQKSDVYISIPITEGVSASLFEAMACGCYPVLNQLPSYEQFIINNKNGTILKILEPKSIAWEILQSLGNQDYLMEATSLNFNQIHEIADSRKNMKIFLERYKELCAV